MPLTGVSKKAFIMHNVSLLLDREIDLCNFKVVRSEGNWRNWNNKRIIFIVRYLSRIPVLLFSHPTIFWKRHAGDCQQLNILALLAAVDFRWRRFTCGKSRRICRHTRHILRFVLLKLRRGERNPQAPPLRFPCLSYNRATDTRHKILWRPQKDL